jgi:GT2 family glycosyltransferase/glycosyltransferase involved in cell wall biosynthesis
MSVLSDLWKFEFTSAAEKPDVTIIVPAFGHIEVTANCLIALARTLELCQTTYEVILVDDASDQILSEVFADMRGLKISRNETNLGFLKSCNGAVKIAAGRDIVLLNNDTIPTGLWLDHLVEFRRKRPDALVVGARLVSADGRLQESGGIIFSDASGWNFGRNWDWNDPRCTYAREVDYCSGAAILIEGEFARAMGPFDERFIPAYYEDTDLCFEARSMGGSVWVEPKAVVVHLEGVSYGKEAVGQPKPYQEKNKKVFLDKWGIELSDQFPAYENLVWRARTRHNKRRIVFVDNEVPRFENNSGALRTISILRLLIESGFEVIFVPINGLRSEPQTTFLESLGIEVLGPLYFHTDYLSDIKETIEQVWISRIDVARQAVQLLQPLLADIPIVFDTVDLHHVRMEREEKLRNSFGRSQQVKRHEIDMSNRSEKVIVVSEEERKVLEGLTSTPVHVISNIHLLKGETRLPPHNHRAAFVGSFQHTPNIDAVNWFVEEVLPLVVAEIPDFEFWIIGDHAPESILKLDSPPVFVKGWVKDLDALLDHMRLNIAPLRFGAGVKGKISHALALGLPTVTTSVGAEGMNLTNSEDIEIADSPELMAEKICLLMRDDPHWTKISLQGQLVAEREFGLERARKALLEVLR